ncbi:hypothetical protein N8Z26_00705 [Burkholderiales bacterium]|nr:hypothetical protein [Burkholderiales bacterium]
MKIICFFVLSLPLLAFAELKNPPVHYTVSVGDDLQSLDVSVCFDYALPSSLFANDGSGTFVSNIRLKTGTVLDFKIDRVKIPTTETDRCIFYDVLFQPRYRGEQRGGAETRLIDGRDILTSIGDWLLRPNPDPDYAQFDIKFIMPIGIYVSAPWVRVDETSFIGVNTAVDWEAIVAFSREPPGIVNIKGSNLEVSILGDFDRATAADMSHWIRQSAEGVSALMGFFPRSRVQVIISPSDRTNTTVPWAYITRGGGAGIHLFVKRDASLEQLLRDYSLPHEMSHFMFPHINSGDYWIIEGLPTYLQHLSMVRSGVITPQESWSRLYRGFFSGKQSGRGYTVAESMRRLARRGTYLHVYWGGAAYFFQRDVDIRVQSQGAVTLLDILSKYHDCCYEKHRSISGEKLLSDLDVLLEDDLFIRGKSVEIESDKFPDFKSTFESLGMQFLGGKPIFEDGIANEIAVQIMNPVGFGR